MPMFSRFFAMPSFLSLVILSFGPGAVAQVEIGLSAGGPRAVEFTVVDAESGAPIADATLKIRIGRERQELKSDAAGRVTLQVPIPRPDFVSIMISGGQGHAGMRAYWENNERKQEALPDSHIFALARSRTIGGVVRDPEGAAVSGAKIFLLLTGSESAEKNRSYVDSNQPIAVTDEKGAWVFEDAPPDLSEYWMRVKHPDFAGNEVWNLKPAASDLYARTAATELTPGLSISGRVVNKKGKPIPQAQIYEGLWSGSGSAWARADDEGRFTLKNLKEMRAVMTVHAEGYAPTMAVDTMKAGMPAVEIVLEPARVLKLKVVDMEGKPVAGANVNAGAWRGGESLRLWPIVFPKTRDDGTLEWNEAPVDAVEYSIFAKDLFPSEPVRITADGKVHTVVMRKPFVVSGHAVDAQTREPVGGYRVFPVLHWKTGGVHVDRMNEVKVKDGRFRFELGRLDCDHGVRIEAEGYRPISTEAFELSGSSKEFSFELVKAPNVQAVLRDAEGVPVRDAKIVVCGAMDQVNIQNGTLDEMFKGFSINADEEGRFAIPPQDGPYVVLAVSERGIAEASGEAIERSGELILRPWGAVRGKLMRGGEAVPGVAIYASTIRLHTRNYPLVFDRGYTQTGSDGGFEFARVAPGSVLVNTQVSPWEQSTLTSGERTPLRVEPGETVEVDFGATGASVIGKLALPEGDDREMAWNWGLNYMYRKAPGVAVPEAIAGMGFSYEKGWNEAWVSTPEGQAYFDTLEGHFVKLTPEGKFRVEGVKPGEYELAFRLYAEPEGTCLVSPISTASFSVTVPETGDGTAPIDLGSLVVEVYPELKAGGLAPDFEVPRLDGGSVSLKDFKGRHVLIDFWATWCGPCREEIAHLRAAWEKYGADDFVILSLSLDADAEPARTMVETEGMLWPQGHLGDWSATTVTKAYNVSGIPATFLIGPDGKLIARDLRGHGLLDAIEKALR